MTSVWEETLLGVLRLESNQLRSAQSNSTWLHHPGSGRIPYLVIWPSNGFGIHYMASSLCYRYGQRSRQWTTYQSSSTSTIIQMWSQAQKALRLVTRHRLKSPRVALTFVVGPAALTLTAKLFGTVAYCSTDSNNNLPVKAQSTEKIPEFSWALLWEFVRPQILALIGAIIVCHVLLLLS